MNKPLPKKLVLLLYMINSVAISQNLFLPLNGRERKRKGIDFGIWQHW
jgi:hypothetical protein